MLFGIRNNRQSEELDERSYSLPSTLGAAIDIKLLSDIGDSTSYRQFFQFQFEPEKTVFKGDGDGSQTVGAGSLSSMRKGTVN